MATPGDVLAAMLRSDPTRPRLTFYDDAEGPTRGERIELSARVLANWVNKAGNALQEELDAGSGALVVLAMPVHWRSVYWAMAAWSVGATVLLSEPPEKATAGLPTGLPADRRADVVVTDDPRLAASAPGRGALVSLPMLARSHPDARARVFDEARELAGLGDVLDVWDTPDPGAPALVSATDGGHTAYGDLVPERDWGPRPRVRLSGTLEEVLRDALGAWRLDGSVVMVREPHGDQTARLESEAVTLDLSSGRR
jgi:uncharacterized protein (TIGR03089 family)